MPISLVGAVFSICDPAELPPGGGGFGCWRVTIRRRWENGPMQTPPRRLLLVRHAHAEQWGRTDFERGLTDGGRAEASEAGRALARLGVVADAALVSAATRAVETWQRLASGARWDVVPALSRSLYGATAEATAEEIRLASESTRTLVVVGHNPTTETLAHLVADDDIDATFHPASFALYDVPCDWADLAWGTARLTDFRAPS